MPPRKKILIGSCFIIVAFLLEGVVWQVFKYQLKNPPSLNTVDELMSESHESSDFYSVVQVLAQIIWIPYLIGFVFFVVGVYQVARLVEPKDESK